MNRRQILSRAIGMALSAGLLVVPFSVTMPQLTVFASEAEAAAAVGAQDVVLFGSLQSKLGARVQMVIAPEAEIRAAIARHYRNEVVPLRQNITEESVLQYNGMLIGVFELLAAARAQSASVVQAIEAERDFWRAVAATALATLRSWPR